MLRLSMFSPDGSRFRRGNAKHRDLPRVFGEYNQRGCPDLYAVVCGAVVRYS